MYKFNWELRNAAYIFGTANFPPLYTISVRASDLRIFFFSARLRRRYVNGGCRRFLFYIADFPVSQARVPRFSFVFHLAFGIFRIRVEMKHVSRNEGNETSPRLLGVRYRDTGAALQPTKTNVPPILFVPSFATRNAASPTHVTYIRSRLRSFDVRESIHRLPGIVSRWPGRTLSIQILCSQRWEGEPFKICLHSLID